jgi:outer membrane protein TolC
MNRRLLRRAVWIGGIVLVAAAASIPATAAPSAVAAAELGEVRGDTLHVDLDRLVTLALAHNERLLAGRAMADAAGAEAAGAWSGLLPRVSLSESFLRTDDALMSFGFKLNRRAATPADFDPAVLNEPGESNLWVTRLQLLQPVFNGGMAWYGKSAANAAARAAMFEQRRNEETVALQCVQAYEGLALALSYHDVVEAAITSAEANAQQAQSLVDAEMATEADLLQAQVFLSGLRQQLITVENQVSMAGEMIRLLTTVETPLVMAARSRPAPGTTLAAPDSADVSGRNDLLAHAARAEAASRMVAVARGAMLPHLNLSLSRDWVSESDIFGDEADSWSLGVYATWDLFKGLENISKLRQSRAERRAAEHLHAFESRRAHHEAQQTWHDARASRARIEVAASAVDAARESLRIVTNQYREGLASMIDLLDVQAAATKAEGDLVQARHDHRVDLARLAHAAGRGVHQGGIQ